MSIQSTLLAAGFEKLTTEDRSVTGFSHEEHGNLYLEYSASILIEDLLDFHNDAAQFLLQRITKMMADEGDSCTISSYDVQQWSNEFEDSLIPL